MRTTVFCVLIALWTLAGVTLYMWEESRVDELRTQIHDQWRSMKACRQMIEAFDSTCPGGQAVCRCEQRLD